MANILEESIWLIGENSELDFWRDNWVGYPNIDKLNLLQEMLPAVKLRDFIHQGSIILLQEFVLKFPNIASDIEHVFVPNGESDKLFVAFLYLWNS